MLQDKILSGDENILLYGITPPRAGTAHEKQHEIAQRLRDRIAPLGIDGLIVYDIQDEASRNPALRPFPFMATIDGFDFCQTHLADMDIPKIVYRSTGNHDVHNLQGFFSADPSEYLAVLVGSPSGHDKPKLPLAEAYNLRKSFNSSMLTGGVIIPERHRIKGDEHLRIEQKRKSGCSFFISQGMYDIDAAKNLISECYYHTCESGVPLAPLIFTFTPCGSEKTLQFMKWLGISVPRWLENELLHSTDILEKSISLCEENWLALKHFAESKHITIGANIESVSIRNVEIEASVELVKRIGRSFVK